MKTKKPPTARGKQPKAKVAKAKPTPKARKAGGKKAAAAELPAGEFAVLPLADICPSPRNARKTFDADELKRLAASIKEKGVLEPVIVRRRRGVEHVLSIAPADDAAELYSVWPVTEIAGGPGTRRVVGLEQAEALADILSRDHYELVAGERRVRASKLAGMTTVPAIVRVLDDKQAAEIGVIENDQRADVPPMEQAEGYEYLISLGDDVETIAAKIGRPEKYVTGRLQLTRLADELKQDLRSGKLPFGHAWLLSRIPAADQVELREGLYEQWGDEKGRPIPLPRLKDRIRRTGLHPLSAAPWSWKDADLVPSAGPCTTCPKRSGNNRTLFDELLDKKDKQEFCTDGACYRGKKAAFIELQVRRVAEKNDGEALRVTQKYGAKDARVLTPDRFDVVTAKEAKAAKPGTVKQAVVVDGWEGDPVGKVVFVKLRKESASNTSATDRFQAEQRKRKRKAEIGRAASVLANATVAAKAVLTYELIQDSPTAMLLLLRPLVATLADVLWNDACRTVVKRRGLVGPSPREAIHLAVGNIDSAAELFGLLAEMIASRRSFDWGGLYSTGSMSAEDKALWAAFGVDRAKLLKLAGDEKKAKQAGKKKGGGKDAEPVADTDLGDEEGDTEVDG